MKKMACIAALLMAGSTALRAQICPVFITHVINGNQVSYSGSSPSNPAAWSWFFNGGSPLTSSQQNPVVTYAMPGTYICALSVSGGPNGCSAALSNKQDTVTISSTGLDESNRTDGITLIRQDGMPVCLISCTRSRAAVVQLMDISGQMVAEVYRGLLQQGDNTVGITATGLAAGTYLLMIDLEGTRKTIKFTWKG